MTPFQIVEAEMIKRGERIDALETENAVLKNRVNKLEKLALYLDKQSAAKTALIGQIIDDLAKAKDENAALKECIAVAGMWLE